MFDLAIGLPLCLVATPLIVALGLALALQHRASPIFVHERIGDGGRVLTIPKLRTLAVGTPIYADKTSTVLVPASRLARLLRATHLDELPQLFLIPLGHLSLVGPRPRMATEATEHGDVRYDSVRTSVLQGCTGLWQISGHEGRVSDRPEFDYFYVQQHSVRLDAWILWRTIRQLVKPTTLELADIPAWVLREPELVLGSTG